MAQNLEFDNKIKNDFFNRFLEKRKYLKIWQFYFSVQIF